MKVGKTFVMRTPLWVWIAILLLSLLQPLVHLLIAYAPPRGTVPTGLHIPDSALFFYSMDMFERGFSSTYATCHATISKSISYYSVPHLWLYGVLGYLLRMLYIDPFLGYGIANGVGAFLYLYVCYRLLCRVAPRYADLAFCLFAFTGGGGGLLYIVTGLMGLHTLPQFPLYFQRFALYELMEGPHLLPVTYFPRLYYTLSLSCCLAGLSAFLHAFLRNTPRRFFIWIVPLTLGTFIDARFGVFSTGLALLYLWVQNDYPWKLRLQWGGFYALPVAFGCLLAYLLMRTNPVVMRNHLQVGNMAMWLSPFLVTAFFHLLFVFFMLSRRIVSLTQPFRTIVFSLLGYLATYGAAYLLYQAYYGNLLAGRDGTVAAAISDWALLGVPIGILISLRTAQKRWVSKKETWVVLWFLLYFAVSISGWGQGWFLQFGPQRLQVFLWLPLCLLAAWGMVKLTSRVRYLVLLFLLSCGLSSILVSILAFQAPYGSINPIGPFRQASLYPSAFSQDPLGPYPEQHFEVMDLADFLLMQKVEEGMVLTPPPASDVLAYTFDASVVFGVGSFNLTEQDYSSLKRDTDLFFSAAASDADRRDIIRRWCVRYVYCSSTWPCAEDGMRELRQTSWLRNVGGYAYSPVLYEVDQKVLEAAL